MLTKPVRGFGRRNGPADQADSRQSFGKKDSENEVSSSKAPTKELIESRRREERLNCDVACHLEHEYGQAYGRLINVSNTGCLFSCFGKDRPKLYLKDVCTLHVGKTKKMESHIVWIKDGYIGLKFDVTISDSDVRNLT